ncbi:ABC transporter substrate-binding protein [Nocardioides sp. LHG3406-4]|uniref:ABC transporter substrate-binding protein n=1 Tax=Nocardioides sp. LHG3406-4 TaxID=2804575 RepID=UPI003CF57B1C
MVSSQSSGNGQRRAAMEAYRLSRRGMLRAGVMGAGAVGFASFLAACSSGSESSGSPSPSAAGSLNPSAPPGTPGGSVTIARAQDAQGFDKTMVFANSSIWVYVNFWETLTISSTDGKSVEPWLAESWTQSDDQLTWTLKIKEGVKFADGTPMTSEDAKFTLDEARSTEGGWEFINSAIKTVSAPDPTTLVIETKYPWAPLLADLACPNNGIVPKDYGGRSKTDYYDAPMGTGPFMWDSWKKGQSITLKKNPNYWREDEKGTQLPYLDEVVWTVVPDTNSRNVQIQGGEVQINETPPFSSIEQLQGSGKVDVTLFPSTRTDYVVMCQKTEFFKDQNVRLAVSHAIDRESLIKAVLYGNGTAANSLFMPTLAYYDESTPGQSYDMDKAKAALAASAYADGFSCTYAAASGDAVDAAIAQVLQSSLKELGITMEIENVDPSALHERQSNLDYEISHTYWTMDIADPDELVQFAVLPEGGGHSMVTGYEDPKAQDLAKQAQQEFDTAKRQEIYSELQKVLAESAFVAPLFYQPLPYATATNVQGFYVKPTGLYDMGVVSLTS